MLKAATCSSATGSARFMPCALHHRGKGQGYIHNREGWELKLLTAIVGQSLQQGCTASLPRGCVSYCYFGMAWQSEQQTLPCLCPNFITAAPRISETVYAQQSKNIQRAKNNKHPFTPVHLCHDSTRRPGSKVDLWALIPMTLMQRCRAHT